MDTVSTKYFSNLKRGKKIKRNLENELGNEEKNDIVTKVTLAQ